MRVFFDTEFDERPGQLIMPISIGMVSESGMTFYGEYEDYDRDNASPWIKKNVLPKLTGPVMSREKLRDMIKMYLDSFLPNLELWAYFATTDFYVLYSLYGTLMDFPESWPKYVMDLKSVSQFVHLPIRHLRVRNENEHNALSDAQELRETFDRFFNVYQASQG